MCKYKILALTTQNYVMSMLVNIDYIFHMLKGGLF